MSQPMNKLQQTIGYKFKNIDLLDESLTHPSLSLKDKNGHKYSYERLEFLGDSALGLVVAEMLIKRHPEEEEGALAKRQSALVRGEALVEIAKKLHLGQHIIMTPGEEFSGGRKNESNLENTLEALIGAIYIDGGLDELKKFIHKWWNDILEVMKEPPKDPKTTLQELVQGQGMPIPEYIMTNATGPAHSPIFEITVAIKGYGEIVASANSKKKAQKEAAKLMLIKMKGDNGQSI